MHCPYPSSISCCLWWTSFCQQIGAASIVWHSSQALMIVRNVCAPQLQRQSRQWAECQDVHFVSIWIGLSQQCTSTVSGCLIILSHLFGTWISLSARFCSDVISITSIHKLYSSTSHFAIANLIRTNISLAALVQIHTLPFKVWTWCKILVPQQIAAHDSCAPPSSTFPAGVILTPPRAINASMSINR